MKILIYSCHFGDAIGIGKFSHETAHWLAERGHNVRAIVAPPYYPQWHTADNFAANRYTIDSAKSCLTIAQCPVWIPRHPSGLTRMLHYMIFALASMPLILWWSVVWRPRIVWVVMPPLASLPMALLGAALSRARSWVHVQDLEVDAAFDLGMLKSAVLRKFMLNMERVLLSQFDVISTVSQQMASRLSSKGLPVVPKQFPNWVDIETIFPLVGENEIRNEICGSESCFIALYAGNLGKKQGIEMLVDVARRLRHRVDIRIVICGEGTARTELQRTVQNITNIRMLPLQPFDRLNLLLNIADVHLLPQRPQVADLVMPSKLGGMLASGRPVIAAAAPESQLAEEIKGCGILVPPGDSESMAEAICSLSASPLKRESLGASARRRALERWTKTSILATFEKRLQDLAGT